MSADHQDRLRARQIGGQTGDVLGATEQLVETAVLLVAVFTIAPLVSRIPLAALAFAGYADAATFG